MAKPGVAYLMLPDTSRAGSWRTVPEILVACARKRAGVPVRVDSSGPGLTAAALLEATVRGASALGDLGIRRGEFVAIDTASLGWRQVAIAYLSVVWLGAVAVMVTSEETERVAAGRVDLTAVISAGARERGPGRPVPFTGLAAGAGGAGGAGESVAQPDDLLDIVFTSGTTGRPKPVSSTHAQWSGLVRPEMMGSRGRRVVGHTGMPIALSGGLHGVMLAHLARGVTSLFGATPVGLLDGCRAWAVTELHLTPYSARAFALVVPPGERWAERVTIIRVMGGPVPPDVAALLSGRFPRARVVSLYGLTEGGAAVCARVVDGRRPPESIGRPLGGTEVRVVGPEGRELPPGQVGEVVVRVAGRAASAYVGGAPDGASLEGGWAR